MNKIVSIFFALLIATACYSQEKDDPASFENALLISPVISLQFPGADLAKRFGLGYQFGIGLDYKFKKNWFVGAEGGFIFGTKVKETSHIKNALAQNGMVITSEGQLDDVNLNLRGASLKFSAGKSFFFKPDKSGNGVLVKLGVGYLQHKILIDVNDKITPQLSGNYAKGYDRFSNGISLSQYLGLIRLERGKFVNVTLGFELTEGFTSNSRPYDFQLNQKMVDKRVDLMYGIKFTWLIPVYTGESTSNQYYTY